ncbi:hypothetical protein A3H53_01250 [Candidatus Nomurabacteria bacterium RIFCSPLOWO2_02_FULL_40_10]|uniref:Type I restriction enzyme HindI endonuclease subunit-like C-terminal domain-containing protein n=1 Tax=Candidatus Nomurabacteria bacterium RIFCSPLOWO2_02_FULL_40_10 TaxID=1801786 RepID=A0A1F6XWW2_9BACT|nr:MAG: hypothetical protein A3H53_01250 [Candidatus Nomurabacteria bacterium RIFCSPLOWO2_02_FULL_40_10]
MGEDVDKVDEERKRRFIEEAAKLEKLHALVMPHREANKIREDVIFFQAVKRAIYKRLVIPSVPISVTTETESAIRKLISESISADEAIDLFAAKDKGKPEISIFDEKFLEEVKKMRFKNLAIEILRKLLRDELGDRIRINEVRYSPLRELLEEIIERYENNIISSSEVIEKLIELARNIKTQEELSFYDAISIGKKGVNGNGKLKGVVKELVKMIRRDISVDWTNNEVIRSRIRADVKLLLISNGFSTEEMPDIVDRIFSQAAVLYADVIN